MLRPNEGGAGGGTLLSGVFPHTQRSLLRRTSPTRLISQMHFIIECCLNVEVVINQFEISENFSLGIPQGMAFPNYWTQCV